MSRKPDAPAIEKIVQNYREDASGCWVWTKGIDGKGYGAVYVDGRYRIAHRVAYELFVGPIPPGLTLDHLCRNRACINPIHLEPVTMRENILRGTCPAALNSRKTHCKNGHAFDDENTRIHKDGRRECKPCGRALRNAGARRRRAARRLGPGAVPQGLNAV